MAPFCCYLLRSVATPKSTASYIGFSIDPHHRLRQHNGEVAAGAWHTSKYRPWIHVVIVSGFPNKILALQFEWIWQHPDKSRFLKTVSKTKDGPAAKKAHGYKAKLKILQAMLNLPIWQQLNLTVYVPDQSMRAFVTELLGGNTNITVLCENFVTIDFQTTTSTNTTSGSNSTTAASSSSTRPTTKRKATNPSGSSSTISAASMLSCAFCAQLLKARDKVFACQHCGRHMHIHCLGRQSLLMFPTSATGGAAPEEGLGMIPRLAECGHCHALCQWKHVIAKATEVLAAVDAARTNTDDLDDGNKSSAKPPDSNVNEDDNEDDDDEDSAGNVMDIALLEEEEEDEAGEGEGEDDEDFDVIILDH